ncbi:MAG: LysR family transcriptional regulator [Leptolyngbyaceae cyanobacterium RM1_1_2]|nr:LysR family transcriptional regulator [Leptolyngbyaceae cyanobacterium RM1_1_2]
MTLKLKLSQLRALVAVAARGNFSEAALNLEVTQSTISHAIATLEDELGVILLQRGRHGARLTPVGERITAKAQQVLALLEDMASAADQTKGLQGGTVRIAAFRSVATHVLPKAIAQLHSRYPSISVSIAEFDELRQLEQALVQGQVDICVAEALCGGDYEVVPIFEDEYIALLPPSAGLRNAQLRLEDLGQYPLIASQHSSCFDRIRLQLAQLSPPREVAYRIRHDSSMTSMVKQGLGVAILPQLAAEPIPEGVQVCRLPFRMFRPIGASLLKKALHTPAVYAFLDALRDSQVEIVMPSVS